MILEDKLTPSPSFLQMHLEKNIFIFLHWQKTEKALVQQNKNCCFCFTCFLQGAVHLPLHQRVFWRCYSFKSSNPQTPARMLDYDYSYGKLHSIIVWQNLKGLGLCVNGKWTWTGLQVVLDTWWFDAGGCKDYINGGFREQEDWGRFCHI